MITNESDSSEQANELRLGSKPSMIANDSKSGEPEHQLLLIERMIWSGMAETSWSVCNEILHHQGNKFEVEDGDCQKSTFGMQVTSRIS